MKLSFKADLLSTANILLKNGAKVDLRDHKGVTPLYIAAWHGFDNVS